MFIRFDRIHERGRHSDGQTTHCGKVIGIFNFLRFYSLYYFAFKIAATEDKYPEC